MSHVALFWTTLHCLRSGVSSIHTIATPTTAAFFLPLNMPKTSTTRRQRPRRMASAAAAAAAAANNEKNGASGTKAGTTKEKHKGVDTFYAPSAEAWRQWLDVNHATQQSVWLIMHHKTCKTPSVYYPEAVDEALCYGWIDSVPNKRDESSFYQLFSKRKPKSNWSKVNREKVAKLLAEGPDRIQPAGMAMIELAKQTGTWTALDALDTVPDDLQQAFDNNPTAYTHWQAFPPSSRRGILEWILNAKRAETRQRRIDETVIKASRNIRANHPKG